MKITDLPQYSVVSKGKKEPLTQSQTNENNAPVLQQIGTGAAKELASTSIGIGSIGRSFQKGLSKGVDALFGTEGFGLGGESVLDKGSDKQTKAQEFLKPEGTAQKTGSFLTEAATFAIPGGAAVKATKGANFATKTGALVASDVGVTAAQQGGLDRESIDAGIIAAAFPIAGKGAQAARGLLPSAPDAGGKVINSLIKPLLKDFSYGKNPGKAVAEAGITANSLDELAIKIKEVRRQTGEEISQRVAQNTDRFNATESLVALDEALTDALKAPNTNSAIITRLQGVKDDLLQVGEDGIPTRKLEDLSATEMWEFNKEIGDLARWTGNASDDEITNRAIRKAYGATRSQLDDAVDGLGVTSEKYANLKSAETATEYRDKIAARQNLVSFSGTQLGTAAAVTSAVVSGGAVMPLIIGAGAAAGTESLKSPAVKTRAAAWLASASKAEREEVFTQAPWIRSALQAALFDETEEVE
jgi:hypothetical protein